MMRTGSVPVIANLTTIAASMHPCPSLSWPFRVRSWQDVRLSSGTGHWPVLIGGVLIYQTKMPMVSRTCSVTFELASFVQSGRAIENTWSQWPSRLIHAQGKQTS